MAAASPCERVSSGKAGGRISANRYGVIGNSVIAPGIPIASSTALAIAAPTALMPLSPAPLMPSGLRVRRKILAQDDFQRRHLPGRRHQVIGERHRQRVAARAVAELLQQRAAQALGETAR